MQYGSNGLNSDGTLMNVGNTIWDPSGATNQVYASVAQLILLLLLQLEADRPSSYFRSTAVVSHRIDQHSLSVLTPSCKQVRRSRTS